MKPPPFEYSTPTSLDEALALLRDLGDEARPLAGGQSLIPLLSMRLARPSHLIDLARIPDLDQIGAGGAKVVIGAMVREGQAERHSELRAKAPLLSDALPFIGHPAIRSRGTIGGSLAHADPAAELPAVTLALDAEFLAQSADRGLRAIPAREFFTGFFGTSLEPDEILTAVRFPVATPGTGTSVQEVARRHGDFAMVGAVTVLHVLDGQVAGAAIALTGVSDVPVRAAEAEKLLVGAPPTEEAFTEAAAATAAALSPPSDLHGSSAYRRHVAAVLVRRTLTAAAERAKEAS